MSSYYDLKDLGDDPMHWHNWTIRDRVKNSCNYIPMGDGRQAVLDAVHHGELLRNIKEDLKVLIAYAKGTTHRHAAVHLKAERVEKMLTGMLGGVK